MFDIGFTEMAVIAVIALVVLGPERLPVVARKLGRIFAYSRRMFSKFQQEIMKEATDLERQVQNQVLAVQQTVEQTEAEIEKLITEEYVDESEEE